MANSVKGIVLPGWFSGLDIDYARSFLWLY